MQELGMLLDNVLDQHRPYLSSVDDSRICCVLFHIATPAVADGVDLVRASFSAVQELHASVGSKSFAAHGRDMLDTRKSR
jgi:hypothetical protein